MEEPLWHVSVGDQENRNREDVVPWPRHISHDTLWSRGSSTLSWSHGQLVATLKGLGTPWLHKRTVGQCVQLCKSVRRSCTAMLPPTPHPWPGLQPLLQPLLCPPAWLLDLPPQQQCPPPAGYQWRGSGRTLWHLLEMFEYVASRTEDSCAASFQWKRLWKTRSKEELKMSLCCLVFDAYCRQEG